MAPEASELRSTAPISGWQGSTPTLSINFRFVDAGALSVQPITWIREKGETHVGKSVEAAVSFGIVTGRFAGDHFRSDSSGAGKWRSQRAYLAQRYLSHRRKSERERPYL